MIGGCGGFSLCFFFFFGLVFCQHFGLRYAHLECMSLICKKSAVRLIIVVSSHGEKEQPIFKVIPLCIYTRTVQNISMDCSQLLARYFFFKYFIFSM